MWKLRRGLSLSLSNRTHSARGALDVVGSTPRGYQVGQKSLPGGAVSVATCDRCESEIEKGHPLDAIVHPYASFVCDDCVDPWDEVVDV